MLGQTGEIQMSGSHSDQTSKQLYKANYDKLISQIKSDLVRWEMIPLSLVGRVQTIRMNVLSRFLLLLNALPITVAVSTFTFLDKLVPKFIWQNRSLAESETQALCPLSTQG